METEGLIDRRQRLTDLGAKLAYHLAEYERQSDLHLACELLEHLRLDSRSRVCDVGCGAGQTVFRLYGLGAAEYVGIDHDIEALALGCRMQSVLGAKTVSFVCASGQAIPFVENRFTHVLLRVALNYMHQARAVREAVRVLKPGGMLFCQAENLGYDLRKLCRSGGIWSAACALYEIAWGIAAALTGFQLSPDGRHAAKRVFAPLFRLRSMLHEAGCDVVQWRVGSSFLGVPVGTTVVARKRSQ
jgi:SAM-dependent methyltransferase